MLKQTYCMHRFEYRFKTRGDTCRLGIRKFEKKKNTQSLIRTSVVSYNFVFELAQEELFVLKLKDNLHMDNKQ